MDHKKQTIVEHLTEFRRRFIWTLACFLLVFLLGFLYAGDIYSWLTTGFEKKLLVLGPNDILWIYVSLSSLLAFSVTLPFMVYQIWQFVRPALTSRESKAIFAYIPATFICFGIGFWFLSG